MPMKGLSSLNIEYVSLVCTIAFAVLCVIVDDVGAASAAAARLSAAYTGVAVVEVCNRELLNVSCGRDEMLYVERALYGRMQLGRCVKQDLGYLGCEVDVTTYIRARCAGKPTCNMRVPDDTLHDYKPCPIDTTSYLQLSHRCVPVLAASANECVLDKSLRRQVTSPGYISSHVSISGGDLGSSRCPWHLQVAEGRRLRLTIEVFTMPSSDSSSNSAAASAGGSGGTEGVVLGQGQQARGNVNRAAGCFDVAVVTEGNKATRVLSCQNAQRLQSELHVTSGQRETWTSTGNALAVELMLDELRTHNTGLVIKYEGVGCTRLALPSGTWARVEGDVASVHCNTTHETWTVHCQDSRWTGPLGNCSQVPSSKWMLNNILLGESEASFPYGILIAVSVGVALGVFLGGFLLALVSLHLKSKRASPKYEMSAYERALRANQQVDLQAMTSECDHIIYGQMALTPDNMADLVKVAPPSNSRSTPNLVYSSGTPVRTSFGTVPRSLVVTGYSTPQPRQAMTLGYGLSGLSSTDGGTCHEHCPLTPTDHFQLPDHCTLRSASDLSTFQTAKRHPRRLQ